MSEVNFNFIDIHAHILPGLDDGASSLTESQALAFEASRNNITDIVATPHLSGQAGSSQWFINRKVKELNLTLKKAGIKVTVHSGAEVGCSLDIVKKIKQRLVLMPSKKHILIHMPSSVLPVFLEELIFKLRLLKITPLFAHIELNQQIQTQTKQARKLVELGALLQITSASLSGHLGKLAQRTAINLLKQKLVFAVASDMHSLTFKPPNFLVAFDVIKKLVSEEYAVQLLSANPAFVCGLQKIASK